MIPKNITVQSSGIRKHRSKILLVFITLSLVSISFIRQNPGCVKGKDLMAMGRSRITSNGLELITSGSYFSFSFTGKDFQLKISLPDGVERSYIQYEIDGVYQHKIKINKGGGTITLSAETKAQHVVTIYKATEAHSGGVFVEEILAKHVKPLPVSSLPLIEFIGDSITCGAASDDSETSCGQGIYAYFHNAYLAYGPRVARALKANFIVSGISGKGVYRNWNNDGPAVPELYRFYGMQPHDNALWDFNAYRPDIISIALGTNDLSDGDQKTNRLPFDREKFIQEYVKFIELLKKYNPGAKIAILNSPMVNREKKQLLEDAMIEIKSRVDQKFNEALPIKLIYFKTIKPRGCNGHPSIEDHREMALEVMTKFKGLLKGKK